MGIIEIKNVSKEFYGVYIFKNLDITIKKGELVSLKGESGCGKTTLLNMIGLLDDKYDGNIIVDGSDIKNINKRNYFKNTLGYLFQNYALIDNKTVSENLDIALEFVKGSKIEKEQLKRNALKKVGLESKYNASIYTLSGGEQQRVAIARILLKPCEIILADEPTGSLDSINRDEVLLLLKELQKLGKTIIIVTHDDMVSSFCDRTIYIKN